MTIFSNFFSSEAVQGQQFKGQNIVLQPGTTKFFWPIPGIKGPIVSQIMNITKSAGQSVIELPPANQTGKFKSILFVNKSENSVVIHSSNDDPLQKGKIIKTLEAYVEATKTEKEKIAAFFIYLEDDKTVAGKWFDIAFGVSGISIPTSDKSINGSGIGYNGQKLFRVTKSLFMSVSPFSITADHSTHLLINNYDNKTADENIVNLPSTLTVGQNSGFFVYILNVSSTPLKLLPSGAETINGGTTPIILQKNISLCICVDESVTGNWLTFISNNALDTAGPVYFPCVSIDKDTTTITSHMNGSTLVCMTEMSAGSGGAINTYHKMELVLPLPETLPPAPTGNGFNFYVVNRGNGEVKFTSLRRINRLASNSTTDPDWMTLGPRMSCQVVSDGHDWFTLMNGTSSGRIIFFKSTINIAPSHFGANFLCNSGDQTINLSTNETLLWSGFRFSVTSGPYNVTVQSTAPSTLNTTAGGSCKIFFVFNKTLKSFPFGTSTFIYDGNGGWWQI